MRRFGYPIQAPEGANWYQVPPIRDVYKRQGYYHAKAVSARIRTVEGATVTINDATPDADGRVANLDLETGLNVITAHVAKDGKEATYVVNISKVETDFRGNVLIPATASANGGSETDNAALTDLDPTTTWTSDPLVRANEWSEGVTGIELHLGEARYVHRVNGWGTPTLPAGVQGWHGGNSVAIAVQETEGGPWKTIVTHASLTRDARGLWYWDFNAYHLATNIRIWMNDETEPQTPQNIATAVTFNDCLLYTSLWQRRRWIRLRFHPGTRRLLRRSRGQHRRLDNRHLEGRRRDHVPDPGPAERLRRLLQGQDQGIRRCQPRRDDQLDRPGRRRRV